MSDRENDPQDQALDPPENTGGGAMSLDPGEKLDPPENTEQREQE